MKPRALILTAVLTVTLSAVVFVVLLKPAVAPSNGTDVAGRITAPQEIAAVVPHEEALMPIGPEQPPTEEAAIVETEVEVVPARERYLPPSSDALTSGTLGRQRVPGSEDIGDVYQLHFDIPSFSLYLAVVEPDGLRAIWRLDQHGNFERVLAVNRQPGEIRIFGTTTGVIFVQTDNPRGTVRTADGFKTWHDVQRGTTMFWGMADDGKGTIWATSHDYNTAVLYRSPDNGFSWEVMTDFQRILPEDAVRYAEDDGRFRLRHLHSIIYNDKTQELVVGTGDVARYALRSRDNGQTWQRIWNEGFTAFAPMSGGSRYLLGPDRLQSAGIAIYDAWEDTVREVWHPAEHGYAGYTYSIVNVDGIYYAAFHTEANEVVEWKPRHGIVVSPDGERWYRFLEWDPLGNHARTNLWLASSPGAIYASVNGALYAFRPLDKGWFADKTPF